MRWLLRISLILAFLGLALLAAWPYWPHMEKELQLLYQTWQQVRAGPSAQAEETPTPSETDPEPKPTRNRQVVTPDQLPEKALPADKTISDRFLAEARRRAEADPEAAMQWLQSQSSGSERLRGMLEVVALWAADDAESALLWLESNAQGLARLETLNNGVELWAASDPAAAANWIDGMANDGSKLTAAKSLATQWSQTQPEAAAKWVSGLPDGPVRETATRALAETWVQQDPKAASIWAFEEAEFNGNYKLLDTTIRAFSKESPETAEAFVRGMAEADYSPIALAAHVLGRAEQDPAATAEWLSQLSPSDPIDSDEYANGLMYVWAESDSIAASEWLSQQAPGARRDAAIVGFSESIQRFEPEAAAAWANTINDPERRAMRLEASLRAWAETNPAEALEWVQSAELDPALHEQLTRAIPRD